MSNLELQPDTESNLQTLETEMILTRKEIEDFKKLSKEDHEKHKDEIFSKLKDLQSRLDQSIQEAIQNNV